MYECVYRTQQAVRRLHHHVSVLNTHDTEPSTTTSQRLETAVQPAYSLRSIILVILDRPLWENMTLDKLPWRHAHMYAELARDNTPIHGRDRETSTRETDYTLMIDPITDAVLRSWLLTTTGDELRRVYEFHGTADSWTATHL